MVKYVKSSIIDNLIVTDGNRVTTIPYSELELSGDLLYSGNHTGAQIAFYWDEDKDTEYIIDLYLGVYYGNASDYDFEFLDGYTLYNKTPDKKSTVTLSRSDYDEFLTWYDMCNAEEFTYYNEFFD